MLCKVCDRLNVTDLLKQAKAISDRNFLSDDYFYFEHHKRYDDLVTAALSGCELCLLLQRQCEDEKIEVYDQDSLVTLEQKFRILEANNRPMDLRVDIKASHLNGVQPFEKGKVFDHLTFQHWESDNIDFSLRIVFILQTSKDQPKFIDDTRIGQFIIDEDLASDANFDIARGWMNNCIVEHSESNWPSFEDKVLPSRVIDVGSEDTNPSLFATNGHRGKWIALSHCWGGRIETILITSNLQSFQKEIKMTSLPANFRDAVLITRALGFQYLWIDCLCIIQDSKYDWGIESKKMGEIYRNAVLTIAAAAAHKAADGILHTQSQTSRDMKPKLKLSKDSGSDDVVEIASSIFWHENLNNLFRSGPLQSRAWAFQERILSPRILWYGRRQIYWQCLCEFQSADGTPSDCESLPWFRDRIHPVIIQGLIFKQNHNDGSTTFSEEELSEINFEYQTMVKDYCTRTMSYPNDKLPAFSGVAALLHEGIGGHYLVGIWSKFFRENLLWQTPMGNAPRTVQYRAPSWSWAVMDGSSARILKLIHLGQYRNPSNKTDFFLRDWVESTGLSSLSPHIPPKHYPSEIPRGKESEIASINIETSYRHAKLRTHYRLNWDEKTPNWLAISPLKYKVMLVGLDQRSKKYRDSTSVLVSLSCLKCLILQEDPEDAKVCRRVGQADLSFLCREAEKPDLAGWLASDWWERETLKLI